MFAIVRAGGHQHKVAVGDTLTVDRLSAGPGDTVTLPALLLIDGDAVTADAAATEALDAALALARHLMTRDHGDSLLRTRPSAD